MTQELNQRLTRVIEQRRLKQKLEHDLQAVEEELQSEFPKLESLSLKLEEEKVDVEKLEQTSLTGLLYSVLGTREQQLEKERQELLAVQLAYQQTKRQVDYLEREQSRVVEQLAKLTDIDQEYEALLAEKEQFLRQANQAAAGELVALTEQIANLTAEHTEIGEAVAAGNEAIASLEQVINALESAADWGTWDILGGGLLSTAVKHSRIDQARSSIDEVQERMSRFKRELVDVQQSVDLQINLREIDVFADYFLDGIIFDWIVQSKILDALERCRQAKGRIAQVVKELGALGQSAQGEVKYLTEKRARLIEET